MSAREQLDALVGVQGALKIITNEIHPDFRKYANDPRSEFDHEKVQREAEDGNPLQRDPFLALKKPSTYVLQDVVRIEDVANDRVRAYSADGSYTEGYAMDVLARLTEHSRT